MPPVPRPWTTRLLCAALLAAPLASVAAVPGLAALGALPQRWRDDDGRVLALADLTGQRVILTMAYASCHRLCPGTIAALQAMQHRLDERGERAAIVVVGYDPASDDPATWRQYRVARRLDRANWHFVTGSPDDTRRLALALGFEFWNYDEHVMHGSRVLIFDAAGAPQVALGPETSDWAAAL